MPTLCFVEVTQLRTEAVELHKCDTKQQTLCRLTLISISTNLCAMVEEVRAIISPPMVFGSCS